MYQMKPAKWDDIWKNNPRIATVTERGDFQLLYAKSLESNMRPYHISKTVERWTYNLDFRPDVGEIYLTDAEKDFGARYAGRVIVEPNIKAGASPNKQWGWAKWAQLASLMRGAGIRVTQLGPVGTTMLPGADLVVTSNFRLACAVLARAKACVLHEGGTHHAAAALGIPGVVIFGGYIAVETTGYSMHRNLGVHVGEACGMRTPCRHCADLMDSISPEAVLNELSDVMNCKVPA